MFTFWIALGMPIAEAGPATFQMSDGGILDICVMEGQNYADHVIPAGTCSDGGLGIIPVEDQFRVTADDFPVLTEDGAETVIAVEFIIPRSSLDAAGISTVEDLYALAEDGIIEIIILDTF